MQNIVRRRSHWRWEWLDIFENKNSFSGQDLFIPLWIRPGAHWGYGSIDELWRTGNPYRQWWGCRRFENCMIRSGNRLKLLVSGTAADLFYFDQWDGLNQRSSIFWRPCRKGWKLQIGLRHFWNSWAGWWSDPRRCYYEWSRGVRRGYKYITIYVHTFYLTFLANNKIASFNFRFLLRTLLSVAAMPATSMRSKIMVRWRWLRRSPKRWNPQRSRLLFFKNFFFTKILRNFENILDFRFHLKNRIGLPRHPSSTTRPRITFLLRRARGFPLRRRLQWNQSRWERLFYRT